MIIVTGGAGFIGSAVVWRLNQLGRRDIVVVDHLGSTDKWKNLVGLTFTDYVEKDEFARLMPSGKLPAGFHSKSRPLEAVIHLGACSSTTEQDASYLIRNNYEYSKQLALLALKLKARFIYASSGATYGDGSARFGDDEPGLEKLRPLNMYGFSKHLFDLWAWRQGLLKKIVGLKYFNVFGPNEYHKGDMRSLVHKAYEQVISTGSIRLFKSYRDDIADGEQKRDFIYVKDAVEMTLHFLTKRSAGGIFNIGSGEANSWNTLAAAIFMALGKQVRIDYIDMPEGIKGKYQYHTCAKLSKLRAAGYRKPPVPLDEAVSDYVRNYLMVEKRLGE